MALTKEQLTRLAAWMIAKHGRVNCPACGGDPRYGDASIAEIGPLPVVALVCGNCAQVMLFSAGDVGLTS